MRSPPSWCIRKRTDDIDLAELTILDDSESRISSRGRRKSSLSSSFLTGISLGQHLNDLPTEVLAEIFYWCTPTVDDQDSCDPRAALILSQVCRHWRTITLASPQLWTYTKVQVLRAMLSPALALMKTYLKRSKSLPVFIDVDFVDDFSYYRPVLNLFEQIVYEARKLRSADAVADSFLATHLEASSTEDRPTREEWYFWSARPALSSPSPSSNTGIEISPAPHIQLANTPAPRQSIETTSTITIRALRIAIGSFVLEPYLPWANSLTFLILRDLHDFTNLTILEAARILSSFPLLVHCSLHIDFEPADALLLETDSVRMQFLKSFSLSWSEWIDTGPLLDALSAPSLRELELVGYLPEVANGGEWTHLVHFLRRNNPPISHIILDQIDCFHVSLLPALTLTSTLEGLWLEDCLLDDSTIRGLAPILTSSLQTLVILDCYMFDIGVLIKVLRETERQRNRKGKVKVYVDGCGDVKAEHIRIIKEMEMDNLEIGPSSMPTGAVEDDGIQSAIEFVHSL